MKLCGLALVASFFLASSVLAVSPSEQRLVDKAKEQLDKYREEISENSADTDAAMSAEIVAAQQGTINQRLKSPFSRKAVGENVVYEFKNAGYQVQKVKELQERLAQIQKKRGCSDTAFLRPSRSPHPFST